MGLINADFSMVENDLLLGFSNSGQVIYKGKQRETNDPNGDGRLGEWSHFFNLNEFEKRGITMIKGDGVMSGQ